MSTSIHGIAVLGVRIPQDKLLRKEPRTHRGCEHSIETGMDFCPKCGARAKITEHVVVFDMKKHFDTETMTLRVKQLPEHGGGESTYFALYGSSGHEWNDLYIGHCVETTNAMSQPFHARCDLTKPSTNVMRIYEELSRALSPLGVFDSQQFGLWAAVRIN